MNPRNLFAELKRRNVIRATILYLGAVWALAQGISQLGPSVGAPEWATRWFLVAAAIGFPFWIAFAWFYEFTPQGLKRDSEIDPAESVTHRTGRKLDFAIIGVLALAVVLLLTDRFVLAPRREAAMMTKALPNETTAAAILEKSIAVLPFDNLSSDKENAYFTDGVQDEILTHLAKVADLKVISRMSVMQYKSGVVRNLRKVAEELGVGHVVEGSVQRAGNKVRVNAQLIDARNDRHEWAENYDRPIDDVFAIQSEIAKAIADQLQAKLSPAEKNTIEQRPTADVVAFEQYSKAKTLMLYAGGGGGTERAFREAVDLLKSATARDPAFHAAFCQLVLANDRLYANGYDHTPERLSAAEEALKKATELRPDSAETHLARAQHVYFALRDYKGALSELDFARQGLPNDPRVPELTGYILRRQGRFEQGLHALQQAAGLDPRNTSLLEQIDASYVALRRYAEAAATLDRAL